MSMTGARCPGSALPAHGMDITAGAVTCPVCGKRVQVEQDARLRDHTGSGRRGR